MGSAKESRFEVIHLLKDKYPIQLLCKIALVSRSGYYKWLGRLHNEKDCKIKKAIQIEYEQLKGIYGYRRMTTLLRKKYSFLVNHKKVYRLMKKMHLQARIRRKRPYIKYSSKAHHSVPNILNRQFHADSPNQKWVTDITYLFVNEHRIYLSVIMDLFNNEVISYQLSNHPTLDFVLNTVQEAVVKTKVCNTMLHSDQGGQYTSKEFKQLLISHGIAQSMSKRGNCLDNAAIESFFSHLKSEFVYNQKFKSKEQFVLELDQYIHFYNNERFQAKLKQMAPVIYRDHYLQSA